MKIRGKYVVFDGMDGCGKGTQINLLKEKFQDSIVFTNEPGGTPYANLIRELVRDNPLASEASPLTQFYLFLAARSELQDKVVQPALMEGKSVISDRGDSSTWAYQIVGGNLLYLQNAFHLNRKWVFDGRREPDLYLIYMLPPEVARARVFADQARDTNHFDAKPLEYYQRVHEGFHRFSRTYQNVVCLNAENSPEEVHEKTLAALKSIGVVP